MRQVTRLLLCVLASTAALEAQDTPEALARQYATAVQHSDFAAAARLMHPAALRQTREMFAPLFESAMFEEMGPRFFGTASRTELAAMADTTYFAALLRNVFSQQAGSRALLESSTTTVLGSVAVGADTAYVVLRVEVSVEGIALSQFDVMAAVRHEGAWRSLLKTDLTNIAAMLRRALGPGGMLADPPAEDGANGHGVLLHATPPLRPLPLP